MNPILELEQVTLDYDGHPVLCDMSLTLREGERVVLRGPSGCGKSTLLRCVLGFAFPSSGVIRLFGTKLDDTSVWSLRHRLAYVPQEPELGEGTAREALERPFQYQANRGLRDRLSDMPAWMDRLGLPTALLDKPTSTLSGGEKQRLTLVGALLLKRSLVLLDEATSALDPANKARVAETLAAQSGLTVLAVSHDPDTLGPDTRSVTLETPA
jgi:ABC-type multidrug transport system ATPase subunit